MAKEITIIIDGERYEFRKPPYLQKRGKKEPSKQRFSQKMTENYPRMFNAPAHPILASNRYANRAISFSTSAQCLHRTL